MATNVSVATAGILAACIVTSIAGTVPEGVHEGAQWFAHADLHALKATTVGERVFSGLNEGDANAKLAALSAVLNFDPRSDLRELTLYGFGGDHDGAVIVRGAFDEERLLTLVRAGGSYESEQHEEHLLHSWIDEKKGHQKRVYGSVYSCFGLSAAQRYLLISRSLKRALRKVLGSL